ncbi:MAG: DUF3999 family protein [Massilia sp.]
MKRRAGTMLVALLMALGCASAVAADTPAEYSHLLPLTVSGKDALSQMRLPQAVYLHARSASLDDLRVFDARGVPLPFTLTQPAPQAQTNYRKLPVKIFPVFGDETGREQAGANLDIRTSADGAVLSVTTRSAPGKPASAQLRALVLDLRRADAPPIDALTFTLPPGATNYSARVELEVSDDMKAWETVAYTSLTWLVNADVDTLANNHIEFSARRLRYARLRWHEGNPIQFAAIVADAPDYRQAPPQREQLVLAPAPGKLAGDLVYQSASAIPVQSIGLQFTEPNIVMPAALGQYVELPRRQAGAPTTFDFRANVRATFFSLSQGGRQRASGDVSVSDIHAPQWVLRPLGGAAARPSLRLSWTPATLIFMANSHAPYRLAFGREQAASARQPLSQVAPGFSDAELQALEQASPGELQVQHAAPRPDAVSEAARLSGDTRQRMLMLWGVLLLGLLILGAMSWRLIRQMKAPPS